MKFGDLAIFAKVGWDILEIRLRYSYLAPVSILFRLQTGAFHENESHFATEFRGSTPLNIRRLCTVACSAAGGVRPRPHTARRAAGHRAQSAYVERCGATKFSREVRFIFVEGPCLQPK